MASWGEERKGGWIRLGMLVMRPSCDGNGQGNELELYEAYDAYDIDIDDDQFTRWYWNGLISRESNRISVSPVPDQLRDNSKTVDIYTYSVARLPDCTYKKPGVNSGSVIAVPLLGQCSHPLTLLSVSKTRRISKGNPMVFTSSRAQMS